MATTILHLPSNAKSSEITSAINEISKMATLKEEEHKT